MSLKTDHARRVPTRPAALQPLRGGEVRTLRTLLGLSQSRFGDLMLVRRMTVWRWEAGISTPSEASSLSMRKLLATLAGKGECG